MEETGESRKALLAAVGLNEVMTERNYIDPFDRNLFHRYTPKDYLHSTRQEMDEVYRMNETILLHKSSGLRVEFLTTENYQGDELRYRVKDTFIITKEGIRVSVMAIDFMMHLFETTKGPIPFDKVEKSVLTQN